MTDKQCVQMIAKRDGSHYPPAYYRHEVKTTYNRIVSSSTVTKALGSYHTRLRVDHRGAVAKAKELLSICQFDHYLAAAMVNQARNA